MLEPQKTVKLKLLRGVLWEGKPYKAGEVLERVPVRIAARLINANKAERIGHGAPEAATDEARETATSAAPRRRSKPEA